MTRLQLQAELVALDIYQLEHFKLRTSKLLASSVGNSAFNFLHFMYIRTMNHGRQRLILVCRLFIIFNVRVSSQLSVAALVTTM